jgi:iron complex outermembrane receptor protein
VTRTGEDAERARLRTEGGSYGTLKSFASTGGVAVPWDGYAAFSHTEGHGYRDHSQHDRQRLYASLGRALEDGARLRLDVNAVRNRQDLPGALTRSECKSGERGPSPAIHYFAERTPIPRYFQVHLGDRHFETGPATVLPFRTFCRELGLP